jgi:hypothetical protein
VALELELELVVALREALLLVDVVPELAAVAPTAQVVQGAQVVLMLLLMAPSSVSAMEVVAEQADLTGGNLVLKQIQIRMKPMPRSNLSKIRLFRFFAQNTNQNIFPVV